MQSMNKQSGLTFITLVLILGIFGFFVLLTLKIVPIYLENNSVSQIVQGLKNDPEIRKASAKKVRELIKRRMKINSIYDFPKENIKIKKTKNRLKVDVTYDKIEPIFANISVLVSFSDVVDIEILP